MSEESRRCGVCNGELGELPLSISMCRGEGPRERASCCPTLPLGEEAEEEDGEDEEEESVGRGWKMELMAVMGRWPDGSGSRGDGMRSWKSSSMGM